MPAFSSTNRFRVRSVICLMIFVGCGQIALAQEEESKSSSLFSGGLVQQLRSLTKDAFESSNSEARSSSEVRSNSQARTNRSFGRANVSRARKRSGTALFERYAPAAESKQVVTTRTTAPTTQVARSQKPKTQPKAKVRADAIPSSIPRMTTNKRSATRGGIGSLEVRNSLGSKTATGPKTQVPKLLLRDESPRELPEVITPEQLLGEVQGDEQDQYELVHVETRLPLDVRDSIRSEASPGAKLDREDSMTYETAAADDGRDGYGIGSLLTEREKASATKRVDRAIKQSISNLSSVRNSTPSAIEPNQAPKVSRVPLPGRAKQTATPGTRRVRSPDGQYSSRQRRTDEQQALDSTEQGQLAKNRGPSTTAEDSDREQKLATKSNSGASSSQGSVSVPTKLVDRPTSERMLAPQTASQAPAPSVQRLPVPSGQAIQNLPSSRKVNSIANKPSSSDANANAGLPPLPTSNPTNNGPTTINDAASDLSAVPNSTSLRSTSLRPSSPKSTGSKSAPSTGTTAGALRGTVNGNGNVAGNSASTVPGRSVSGRTVSGPSIQNTSRPPAYLGSNSGGTTGSAQQYQNAMRSTPSNSDGGQARQSTSPTNSATRTSAAPATLPGSNYGERLKMLTPRLQVTFNGPQDLPVGEPASYQLEVLNDDRINLNGLLLRMDVPKGVSVSKSQPNQGAISAEKDSDGSTMLTWQFDSLASGQKAIAPMQLTANSPRNFAVAMEWTVMPITGDAALKVRAPRLELALEGPSEVTFGQPNTYRLHLRNAGDAPADNVQVNLTAGQYGSSSTNAGTIAPGQQEVVDIELTFNQKGSIQIEANATAAGNLSSKTQIGVLVRKPDLSVHVEAPSLVYHGKATKYLVQVRNSGDAPAANVQATLDLPAGAKPASLPPGARLNGQQVSWPIALLSAGDAKTFEFAVDLQTEGANLAQVSCADALGSTAKSSCRTELRAVADLKLLVSDPIAPAPVGSEVVYELQITNRGSKAATDVRVIAQFSEGIEPKRGEGHEHRVVPGQVFFEPIQSIGPNATTTLRVIAIASQNGTHRFRAEVRSAGTEVKLVQEESTEYLQTNSKIAAPPSGKVFR